MYKHFIHSFIDVPVSQFHNVNYEEFCEIVRVWQHIILNTSEHKWLWWKSLIVWV